MGPLLMSASPRAAAPNPAASGGLGGSAGASPETQHLDGGSGNPERNTAQRIESRNAALTSNEHPLGMPLQETLSSRRRGILAPAMDVRSSLPTCRYVGVVDEPRRVMLGGVEASMAVHLPKSAPVVVREQRWV